MIIIENGRIACVPRPGVQGRGIAVYEFPLAQARPSAFRRSVLPFSWPPLRSIAPVPLLPRVRCRFPSKRQLLGSRELIFRRPPDKLVPLKQ